MSFKTSERIQHSIVIMAMIAGLASISLMIAGVQTVETNVQRGISSLALNK